MNIVRELRKKKGIQQKELALEIGVSNATVSEWEHGKKDPSKERLQKLADYFGVEPMFILGYGKDNPSLFVPENPKTAGVSETQQIVEYVLQKLAPQTEPAAPKTPEARIVSGAMDKLPQEQREQVLNVFKAMFPNNPDLFK